MAILEIHNISKNFDAIKAIDGFSISFNAGKITGLIGPNGSGKSTLINLISGMIQFDSGVVIISEDLKLKTIEVENILNLGITRTFQEVRLFEQMTVLDNILIILTPRNAGKALFKRESKVQVKKAKEVLERVDLWEKRDQLAVSLSYGQRKLLEIARVLATDADIFLFDEPFAGLFPEMVKMVSSVLKELRNSGKAVVLVEHNMEIIRELSDYCIVMDSGELLAKGNPEEVLAQKKVIEAYLGE